MLEGTGCDPRRRSVLRFLSKELVLTGLSSVASQELALALVPELPGHACAHNPVVYHTS